MANSISAENLAIMLGIEVDAGKALQELGAVNNYMKRMTDAERERLRIAEQAQAKEAQKLAYEKQVYEYKLSTMSAIERAERVRADRVADIRAARADGTIGDPLANNLQIIENRKLEAVVESEAKRVKAERDASAKRTEQRDKELDKDIKREQANDAKRINLQRARYAEETRLAFKASQEKAAATSKESDRATKVIANERIRLLNISLGLESSEQRLLRLRAEFDAGLASGAVNANEYAVAIANIDRQQQSMQQGAGRMGYVVGNLATGFEDFITVMSITGFSMDSVAASTRAASNNIGQAVRGLGTSWSAILAPMISIGAIGVGFAIPAIYKWVVGADAAADATERWRIEIEKLIKIQDRMTDLKVADLERAFAKRDIGKMKDSEEIEQQINDVIDKLMVLNAELEGSDKKLAGLKEAVSKQIFGENNKVAFDKLADAIGLNLGPEQEAKIRADMEKIKKTFNEQLVELGGEAALEQLRINMSALTTEITATLDGITDQTLRDRLLKDLSVIDNVSGINPFTSQGNSGLLDAAIVNQIEKLQEEMKKGEDDINRSNEERVKLLDEQRAKMSELLALQKQIAAARREEEVDAAALAFGNQIANAEELRVDTESLKLQSKRNQLIGEEHAAANRLLDLALRRREIMESGLLAPAELEKMFLNELDAEITEVEKKLKLLTEGSVNVLGSSSTGAVEAFTSANAQAQSYNATAVKQREQMIKLLEELKKARKDPSTVNLNVV